MGIKSKNCFIKSSYLLLTLPLLLPIAALTNSLPTKASDLDKISTTDKTQLEKRLKETRETLNKVREEIIATSSSMEKLTQKFSRFQQINAQLELIKDDAVTASNTVDKLYYQPQSLKDCMRLYVKLSVLEQRMLVLKEKLKRLETQEAMKTANKWSDLAVKVASANFALFPYFSGLIYSYEKASGMSSSIDVPSSGSGDVPSLETPPF